MINTDEIKLAIEKLNKDKTKDNSLKLVLIQDAQLSTATVLVRRKKSILRLKYEERATSRSTCDICGGEGKITITIEIRKNGFGHHDGMILKQLRMNYKDHKPNCPEAKDLLRLAENIQNVKN